MQNFIDQNKDDNAMYPDLIPYISKNWPNDSDKWQSILDNIRILMDDQESKIDSYLWSGSPNKVRDEISSDIKNTKISNFVREHIISLLSQIHAKNIPDFWIDWKFVRKMINSKLNER